MVRNTQHRVQEEITRFYPELEIIEPCTLAQKIKNCIHRTEAIYE